MLLLCLGSVFCGISSIFSPRVRSNFPTVLYQLLVLVSQCMAFTRSIFTISPKDWTTSLAAEQTHFHSTPSSSWICNLKVSHCLHFFIVTWVSISPQEEYSYVPLDAKYHKCNTQCLSSLTFQTSANNIPRKAVMKISMAGGNFSSSLRCQSANPSLIQS